MNVPFKARLRDARYALPGLIERHVGGETATDAARSCLRLAGSGVAITAGYSVGEGGLAFFYFLGEATLKLLEVVKAWFAG